MISLVTQAAKNTFSYPTVAVWILVAVGASVMGPFGTYTNYEWGPRTGYWFTICGSSVFLSQLVRGTVSRYVYDNTSWRFDVAAIVVMTLVLTPFVFGLSSIMMANIQGTPPDFWRIGRFVLLTSALITAIRRIHRFHQLTEVEQEGSGSIFMAASEEAITPPEESADNAEVAAQECRLRLRLPPELRDPILHLSARDHFVDVETGSALYSLRMRFADAVAEMDGVEGHITHRSHWIAADAVRGSKRGGGKLYLVLSNGTEVPVSRTFRHELEAAGLL